jgi:predicted nucleic acid-binding protein
VTAEDRVVVDGSVVVKWFLAEEHQDQARAVLRAIPQLVAPELLLSEVGNAVLKKLRRNETTADAARVALRQLPGPLTLLATAPLLESRPQR